jgi:hypothetical protein
VDETLREFGGVEGLENVFVFDILEQYHLQESVSLVIRKNGTADTYNLVQRDFEITFLTQFVILSQQGVSVLSKKFWRLGRRRPRSRILVDKVFASL